MTVEATQANFDDLIGSTGVAMVDFGAEWCGPCRSMAPIIDELAEQYQGRVRVATCDVEENNDVAVKFSIRNVPTILFFKDGQLMDRQVGAVAKNVLEQKLASLL